MQMYLDMHYPISIEELTAYLKKENDQGYLMMKDQTLAAFLNALIVEKRGRKDDQKIVHEKRINNNVVLRKLKIALSMKDDDIIDVLKLVDLRVSKHEISAFFRNPKQSQYRLCKDQFLRNFLLGLQHKFQPNHN